MSVTVADTGPLNYLVLIDLISLLPNLFERVVIADAVRTELGHPEAPARVRNWIASSPSWLVTHMPKPDRDHQLDALGNGERESIKLAQALNADLLLMDDRAAVIVARARGLQVTGTLGVLDRAADRGCIDLADSFARLQATSFRVRTALLDQLVALHMRRHGS